MRYVLLVISLLLPLNAMASAVFDDGTLCGEAPYDPEYTFTVEAPYGEYYVIYNTESELGLCGDTSGTTGNRVASVDCDYLVASGGFPTSTLGNYSLVTVSNQVGCWNGGTLLDYSTCKGGAGFVSENEFVLASSCGSPSSTPSSTTGTSTMTEFEMELSYYMLLILVFIVAGAVYSLVRPR